MNISFLELPPLTSAIAATAKKADGSISSIIAFSFASSSLVITQKMTFLSSPVYAPSPFKYVTPLPKRARIASPICSYCSLIIQADLDSS